MFGVFRRRWKPKRAGHGRKHKEKEGCDEGGHHLQVYNNPGEQPQQPPAPPTSRVGVVVLNLDKKEDLPAVPNRTCSTALVAPFNATSLEEQNKRRNIVQQQENNAWISPTTQSDKEVWVSVMDDHEVDHQGAQQDRRSGGGGLMSPVTETEKTDVVKELLEKRVVELEQLLEAEMEKAATCAAQLAHELQANQKGSGGIATSLELEREHSLRVDVECRLQEVIRERETANARLAQVQDDLTKLEEMVCSLLQYKARVERMQKEKASANAGYESQLHHLQRYAANLEKENLVLLGELKALEASNRQSDGRERSLSRVLLERLRYLEAENSSLVLETEQQRVQYERCLDDVANQVVRAVLMQRGLRDECVKLHKRVKELEQRNRSLSVMLQQRVYLAGEPGRGTTTTATPCATKDHNSTRSTTTTGEGSVLSLSSSIQSPQLTPNKYAGSSNQSSMAIQTSHSEDSLESLASLCSEYSLPSIGSGGSGGIGGSCVAINVPGWPQLSSPPLWVKKHLDRSRCGSGPLMESSMGANTARWSLDDGIWPGLRLCDLEELGADIGSGQMLKSLPDVVVSSDEDEGEEAMASSCLDSVETPNEDNLQLESLLLSLPRSVKMNCIGPPGLTFSTRPQSLNLASSQSGCVMNASEFPSLEMDRPPAGAGNVYTSPSAKPFPTEEVFVVRGESPNSGDSSTGRDEGYSTMSSDAPPNVAEETTVLSACASAPVVEENDEDNDDDCGEQVHGFENDLAHSLILVRDKRISEENVTPLPVGEIAEDKTETTVITELIEKPPRPQPPIQLSTTRLLSLCAPQGFKARPHVAFLPPGRVETADKGTGTEPSEDGSNLSIDVTAASGNELKIVEDDEDCYDTVDIDGFDSPPIPRRLSPRTSPPKFSSSFPQSIECSASDSNLSASGGESNRRAKKCMRSASFEMRGGVMTLPPMPQRHGSLGSLLMESELESVMPIASDSMMWHSKTVHHLASRDDDEDTVVAEERCDAVTDDEVSPCREDGCVAESLAKLRLRRADTEPPSVNASDGAYQEPEKLSRCNSLPDVSYRLASDALPPPATPDFLRTMEFRPDFYQLCQVETRNSMALEADEDDCGGEGRVESLAAADGGGLGEHSTTQEKLQELSALLEAAAAASQTEEMEEQRTEEDEDSEPKGKEGCTTSWIHVEADVDLTDPKARANLLDTMLASTSSSSSSSSNNSLCGEQRVVAAEQELCYPLYPLRQDLLDGEECGEEPPEYQHLHQLHRYRRHRKATELENCVMRYIPPARPSILGRRDFFFRYGEQEQAAVASFDFLEDLSTSASDAGGSAEMLDAVPPNSGVCYTVTWTQEQKRPPPEEEDHRDGSVTPVLPDEELLEASLDDGTGAPDDCDRLSLSDSCAGSYASSNQSLNTLE